MLRNISQRLNNRLMVMSISWFFAVILMHLAFLYYWFSLLRVAALLLLVANAVESYLLIYDLVKSFQHNAYLHDLAYFDGLTGLRNRVRLFLDADGFIEEGRIFRVLYLDLNDFKSVNDTHGHKAGDAYLRFLPGRRGRFSPRRARCTGCPATNLSASTRGRASDVSVPVGKGLPLPYSL